MRLLAIALLLGGCTDDTDDRGKTCTDDFASAAIDARIWSVYEQPPATIRQRNGRLATTLADRAIAYATLYSVRVGFSETPVSAEIGEVPQGPGAEALLQIAVTDRYRDFISVEDGRLYFGKQIEDAFDVRDIAFDPAAHRYWRLGHDATSGDRVTYQTSADGTTWTTQHETGLAIRIDDAYLEVGAGTYMAVPSPGVASFERVSIEGSCSP